MRTITEFRKWMNESGHLYFTQPPENYLKFKTAANRVFEQKRGDEPDSLDWFILHAKELSERIPNTTPATRCSYASRARSAAHGYIAFEDGRYGEPKRAPSVIGKYAEYPQPALATVYYATKTLTEEIQDCIQHFHKWPKLMPYLITAVHDAVEDERKPT